MYETYIILFNLKFRSGFFAILFWRIISYESKCLTTLSQLLSKMQPEAICSMIAMETL